MKRIKKKNNTGSIRISPELVAKIKKSTEKTGTPIVVFVEQAVTEKLAKILQ